SCRQLRMTAGRRPWLDRHVQLAVVQELEVGLVRLTVSPFAVVRWIRSGLVLLAPGERQAHAERDQNPRELHPAIVASGQDEGHIAQLSGTNNCATCVRGLVTAGPRAPG